MALEVTEKTAARRNRREENGAGGNAETFFIKRRAIQKRHESNGDEGACPQASHYYLTERQDNMLTSLCYI